MRGSNHFGSNYKMFESQANSIYPVSFWFIKCIIVKFELLFHFSQLSKSKNKKCIQLNPFYSKCNFEKMTNIWFFFSFSKLFASYFSKLTWKPWNSLLKFSMELWNCLNFFNQLILEKYPLILFDTAQSKKKKTFSKLSDKTDLIQLLPPTFYSNSNHWDGKLLGKILCWHFSGSDSVYLLYELVKIVLELS